jgi:hypothetical protein
LINPFEFIVLDIDGSVVHQKRLLTRYHPTVIESQQLAESLRFWCRQSEMNLLQQELSNCFLTDQPKLIFYGSGDFHHLAYLGISLIEEPFTLIQFDNHTDFWKPLKKDFFDFGSWVSYALRLPKLKKVIQLGVDGDLRLAWYLPFPTGRYSHNMDLLLQGQIEVYPNRLRRSILMGRMKGDLACARLQPGLISTRVTWKNMQDWGGVEETIERLIPTIPTEGVYITIDKDVLKETENFAGYRGRQGNLSLKELLSALSLIGQHKRILGADVCGEGSHNSFQFSRAKRLLLWQKDWMLSPSSYTSQEVIQRNEKANLRIIEQLFRSRERA